MGNPTQFSLEGRAASGAHGSDVALSRLKLIAGTSGDHPAPSALRVIETLSHAAPRASADLAAIRRAYNESRRALLAPLETVDSIIQIRPCGGVPPLTVIRPRGNPEGQKIPAILYLHGGGWTLGGLETYAPFCRQLANITGCAVIWVEYRLAPEHPFPAAYDDTRNALSWVHQNADWLGVDRSHIAIGGDSAGGNLAAVTALALRDSAAIPLWFQLLIYPCLDLTAAAPSHKTFAEGYLLTAELYRWYRRNYLGHNAHAEDWRLSPLFADTQKGVAPAVILYAGFDPLRDEAEAYAIRLNDDQVPVEQIYFPGMIHGFITMGAAIPAAHVAITRIAMAIRKLTAANEDISLARLIQR